MPQKNYNPSKSLSEDLCNLIAFAEANNLFQFTGKDSSYFKGILEEFDSAKEENANRRRKQAITLGTTDATSINA